MNSRRYKPTVKPIQKSSDQFRKQIDVSNAIHKAKNVRPKKQKIKKTRSTFKINMNIFDIPIHRIGKLTHYIGNIQSYIARHRIYVMASAVFLLGMVVAIDGYMTNQDVKREVLAIAAYAGEEQYVESAVLPSEPDSTDTEAGTSLGSETLPSSTQISNYSVAPNHARYLKIPSIDVYSRVYSVGETLEGAVASPWGIHNVGWYDKSSNFDAKNGAAFVVGHVHGYTAPGVFNNLKNLKKDDIVEVERGDGKIMKFKVVTTKSYKVGSVDMRKALNPVNPDKFGLNLMTCGGLYDSTARQYTERLLVRTEQVS